MKVEKLPSGSFRVRKTYKGKSYSLTFDHRPTKDMILQALMERVQSDPAAEDSKVSFRDAALAYVASKENVLSPSTLRDYHKYPDRIPAWFCELRMTSITQVDVNNLINELSVGRSPKTVRNYHGFVSAVLSTYRPEFVLNTKLPQKIKREPYIPTSEDIRKLLQATKGTRYEIPIRLGCYGLRRSEICGLTLSDLDKKNNLSINKAMVFNKDNQWIVKPFPKNYDSTRIITIDKDLAKLIRSTGCIYDGHPGQITEEMKRLQKKLGIPAFSLHKCHHYFASKLHDSGIPDQDIMDLGGWKTDHIMKSVYRHALKDEKEQKRKKAAAVISESICN